MEEANENSTTEYNERESDASQGNPAIARKSELKPVELKLTILGQSRIGKTALLHSYIYNKYLTDLESTIEDKYSIPTEVEGFKCNINITDTSGEEDYQNMLDSWINSSDGFLLTYSIDNKESFEAIKLRYDKIMELKKGQKFYILVIGCKSDLENARQVQKEEVEKYCKSRDMKFLETSSLQNKNVKEAFLMVVGELLRVQYPEYFEKNRDRKKCYCF